MPAQRKYPEELRERAVKMVLEIRDREGKGRGEIARVGRQLGIHPRAPAKSDQHFMIVRRGRLDRRA
jgi:transposase-like protein